MIRFKARSRSSSGNRAICWTSLSRSIIVASLPRWPLGQTIVGRRLLFCHRRLDDIAVKLEQVVPPERLELRRPCRIVRRAAPQPVAFKLVDRPARLPLVWPVLYEHVGGDECLATSTTHIRPPFGPQVGVADDQRWPSIWSHTPSA